MKLAVGSDIETNCNLPSTMFRIEASPITFELLSTKLYSDPELAMVRELLTNAYDSHIAAGTTHIPIDIHFPTWEDDSFSIRDYGTGLSKEGVFDLYTVFFKSTKSNSNDFTGCFGLGSKTPFSCVSSFSVTSFFNGMAYFFICMKKNGLPHVMLVKEEQIEEPNGFKIVLSGVDKCIYKKAEEFLKFVPEIRVKSNRELNFPKGLRLLDRVHLYKDAIKPHSVIIKQGQNTFLVDIPGRGLNDITRMLSEYLTIVIEVPIGTYEVTPSRETLVSNKAIEEYIVYMLSAVVIYVRKHPVKIKSLCKATFVTLATILFLKSNRNFCLKIAAYSSVDINNPYAFAFIPYNWENDFRICFYTSEPHTKHRQVIIASEGREVTIVVSFQDRLKRASQKIGEIFEQYGLLDTGDYCTCGVNVRKSNKDYIFRNFYFLSFLSELNRLNKFPHIDFKIRVMLLDEFLEKYPIQKNRAQEKKLNETKRLEKEILYHALEINDKEASRVYRTERQREGVKNILKRYDPNYTLVLEDNNENYPRGDFSQAHGVILEYGNFPNLLVSLFHIKNTRGKYFLRDFFWDKYSRNYKKLHILFVKKCNLSFFKDYLHITEQDVRRLLEVNSIRVMDEGLKTELADLQLFLRKSHFSMCCNLKGKQKAAYKNSRLFKRLQKVIGTVQKWSNINAKSLYLKIQLETLLGCSIEDSGLDFKCYHKDHIDKIFVECPTVKTIKEIHSHTIQTFYKPKPTGNGINPAVNTYYWELPVIQKDKLLRIIKDSK